MLTQEEKMTILQMLNEKVKVTDIVAVLSRNKSTIYRFINKIQKQEKKKPIGRPKKLSDRTVRAIVKSISGKIITPRQIKADFGPECSPKTIKRAVKASSNLVPTKIKKKPALNDHHKKARLDFAERHLIWRDEWHKIIWSDEKRFTKDGPDSMHYYQHDKTIDQTFLKKSIGRGANGLESIRRNKKIAISIY